MRTWDFIFFQSEQSRDLSLGIHVDIDGGGLLGQAGHGHNVAADDHHETGTGGKADFPHLHGKAGGRTGQLGVIAETVLGLGDADRQVAVAQFGQFGQRQR